MKNGITYKKKMPVNEMIQINATSADSVLPSLFLVTLLQTARKYISHFLDFTYNDKDRT